MDRRKIAVKSSVITAIDSELLSILLLDKTTKKNIIWATDDYSGYGFGYYSDAEITVDTLTGIYGNVISPRIEKSKHVQEARSKEKAEVFTPSWVCNKQNNLIDCAWFGFDPSFNVEAEKSWVSNPKKIMFSDVKGRTWQDYVKATRLEVSCGEAPYLVSRYDTVTGDEIPVADRIGLLDRKLRVVSENIDSESEWINWAKKAIQNTYGYDWQGDNVLLARENVLLTFAEYYQDKFGVPPIREHLTMIAKIIAWNIWQMDGIRFVIPNSCHDEPDAQLNWFDFESTSTCPGCLRNDHSRHNGIYCRTYDWSANRSVEFYSLIRKEGKV